MTFEARKIRGIPRCARDDRGKARDDRGKARDDRGKARDDREKARDDSIITDERISGNAG